MVDRLKKALVESFAGAIAVGWLLSEGIYHCALLIVSPITIWAQLRLEQQRNAVRSLIFEPPQRFPYEQVLSQFLMVVILLLLAYLLLRWLYLEPARPEQLNISDNLDERE